MFVDSDGRVHRDHYQSLQAKLDRLRSHVSALHVDDVGETRGMLALIDQLERDMGRALLLLHATVETLVENRLVTREQLAAKSDELDLLDAQANGRLDPALFRTEEEITQTPSASLYLYQLNNAAADPADYLKRLENE